MYHVYNLYHDLNSRNLLNEISIRASNQHAESGRLNSSSNISLKLRYRTHVEVIWKLYRSYIEVILNLCLSFIEIILKLYINVILKLKLYRSYIIVILKLYGSFINVILKLHGSYSYGFTLWFILVVA